MKKHPLDKAFDVPDDRLIDDSNTDIEIPEDPTLDTIISLSLKAYKEQMEDIIMIEPKNRARYLEVAERFLDQAKDAMAKKEQLRLQREKQTQAKQPAASPAGAVQQNVGTPVTRQELLERVKSVS